MTEEQLREVMRIFASRGGKATAAKMTREQRSERARRAVEIRWARYRRGKQSDKTRGG